MLIVVSLCSRHTTFASVTRCRPNPPFAMLSAILTPSSPPSLRPPVGPSSLSELDDEPVSLSLRHARLLPFIPAPSAPGPETLEPPIRWQLRETRLKWLRRCQRLHAPRYRFAQFRQFWVWQAQQRTLNEALPRQAPSFWHSVGFALDGLRFMALTQRNFRIDCYIALGCLIAGWWLGLTLVQWCTVIGAVATLLMVEMANTLLEWWVDWQTQGQYDLRAKRLKDVSAGMCLTVAGAVGLVLLLTFADAVTIGV
jgi:undecaprenol kinase